jgi:hypothetical protein
MMASNPPGHYTDMIAAIRNLEAAKLAALNASKLAADSHHEQRLAAFRKMEAENKLKQPGQPHGT